MSYNFNINNSPPPDTLQDAEMSFREMMDRAGRSSPPIPNFNESVLDPQLSSGSLNGSGEVIDDEDGADLLAQFRPGLTSTPSNNNISLHERRPQITQQQIAAIASGTHMRLSQDAMTELQKFAMSTGAEQRLKLYANQLVLIEARMQDIRNWKPNGDALLNIKSCCTRYLIAPDVQLYKSLTETGVEKLLDLIPSNGLPSSWKHNPAQAKICRRHMLNQLTQTRRDVKNLIAESLTTKGGGPLNIKDMAEKIANYGKVQCTPLHWARFALLRAMVKEKNDEKLYDRVDAELIRIREEAQKKYEEQGVDKVQESIHRTLMNVLTIDMSIYGRPRGFEASTAQNQNKRARTDDI